MNEWVWSIGGIILTGENWSTWRKTCPSATLFTTNLTRTAGSHSVAEQRYGLSLNVIWIYTIQFIPHRKHTVSVTKTKWLMVYNLRNIGDTEALSRTTGGVLTLNQAAPPGTLCLKWLRHHRDGTAQLLIANYCRHKANHITAVSALRLENIPNCTCRCDKDLHSTLCYCSFLYDTLLVSVQNFDLRSHVQFNAIRRHPRSWRTSRLAQPRFTRPRLYGKIGIRVIEAALCYESQTLNTEDMQAK
jgi:hypothetical protein